MLALLSKTTSRLLDVQFDQPDSSLSEDENVLFLDLNALRELIPGRPCIRWQRVVGVCGEAIAPMYRRVHDTLSSDVEHLAKLFSEIEPSRLEEKNCHEDCLPLVSPSVIDSNLQAFSAHQLTHRTRRRSSNNTSAPEALIIPGPHASVPTIIITLCPSQPGDSSCRVPCQDASFGNKLSVPNHPAMNDVFPPLAAESLPTSYKPVEKWQYTHGHWWAILPALDDQAKKGIFSRPTTLRRRTRVGSQRRTSHR